MSGEGSQPALRLPTVFHPKRSTAVFQSRAIAESYAKKTAPAQLLNPDGTVSVGLVTSKKFRDPLGSLPTEPFVVLTNPVADSDDEGWVLRVRAMYILVFIDIILVSYFSFARFGQSNKVLALLYWMFDIAIAVAALYGVRKRKVRYLSLYMLYLVIEVVIGIVQLYRPALLITYAVKIALIRLTQTVRNRMLPAWFVSSGHRR